MLRLVGPMGAVALVLVGCEGTQREFKSSPFQSRARDASTAGRGMGSVEPSPDRQEPLTLDNSTPQTRPDGEGDSCASEEDAGSCPQSVFRV